MLLSVTETCRLECNGAPLADNAIVGMPPLTEGATVHLTPGSGRATGDSSRTSPAGSTGAGAGAGAGPGPESDPVDDELRAPRARVRSSGRDSVVDLAVTSGPDCGHRLPLGREGSVIGRPGFAALGLQDNRISRRHARVTLGANGVTLTDLTSTNGTRVDGERLSGTPRLITQQSRIALGDTKIRLVGPAPSPTLVSPIGDGYLLLQPRTTHWSPPATVQLSEPSPPTSLTPPSPPWIGMLVPLPIAVVLALVFGPHYLLFAALGPATMGASWLHDRRRHRRRWAEDLQTHAQARREVESELATALATERSWLERHLPDAVTILDLAQGRSEGLWSRPGHAPGFATVRLGLADQLATSVRVSRGGESQPIRRPAPADTLLAQAPLGLTCRENLLVSGTREATDAVLRHLVGQLAVLHDPADLEILLLHATGRSTTTHDDWAWVSSLPHARRWRDVDLRTEHGRAAVLAELTARHIRAQRNRDGPAPSGGRQGQGRTVDPSVVLVVPDETTLSGWPDIIDLLTRATDKVVTAGDGAGGEGRATSSHHPGVASTAAGTFVLMGRPATTPSPPVRKAVSTAVQAPASWSRLDVAPDGATLRGPGGSSQAVIPDGVGLWWAQRLARALAPLQSDRSRRALTADEPMNVWQLHSLRSPSEPDVGEQASAAIHEHWDSRAQTARAAPRPRALIGQCSDRPWSIDLVEDGPHLLLGGTTGSGKSEFLRALILGLAIDASPEEVTFLLIDYKGGSAFGRCADLPHTVGLVTDLDPSMAERALASLRAEIHRRERLLADHGAEDLDGYWILTRATTSRPRSGPTTELLPRLVVVIDEFRVLAQEHLDVLGGLVHCAAVGRSLGIHLVLATQRPAGVISPEIQANVNLRIALRLRDATDSEQVIGAKDAAWLDPNQPGTGWARFGSGELLSFAAVQVGGPLTPAPPEVDVHILDEPGSGAAEGQSHHALDVGTDEEALVRALRGAHELSGCTVPRSPWLPPLPSSLLTGWADDSIEGVPWGLIDLPEEQRQDIHLWQEAHGIWRILGGPQSGRSTAVVGLVQRLTERFGPEDLHVYAVDGASSLARLADLPHVGAVVEGADTGRLRRLLQRLETEVSHRRAGGSGPRLMVVIDEWDRLVRPGSPAQEHLERLASLCSDARGLGVHLVTAGGPLLASTRVLRETRTACLNGLDSTVRVAQGLRGQNHMAQRPPGRAVLTESGHHLQFAPSHPARIRLGPWRDGLPSPVTDLPIRLQLTSLPEEATPPTPAEALLLGLGHDGPIAWDASRWGRHLLVVGPGGSGRTTTLRTLAAAAEVSGRHTVAVSTAHDPSARTVLDPADERGLRAVLAEHPDALVLIDDADALTGTALDAALPALSDATDARKGLLAVAIRQHTLSTAFRGVVPLLAQRQTALVLAPQSRHDGDALGVRVDVPVACPPGRGVLIVRGRQQEIQVALP